MWVRWVCIGLCVIFISGCVGFLSDDLKVAPGSPSDFYEEDELVGLKKTSVLEKAGEPESIIVLPGGERWVYPYKHAWRGGVLFAVVIPVPLKLPIGSLDVLIDFQEDYVTAISYEYIDFGVGYACGPGYYLMSGMTYGYEPAFCGPTD